MIQNYKYRKLDPEFKAAWLKALRSNRYRQVRHHLRGIDPETRKLGYCCLGVACNIKNDHRWASSAPGDSTVDAAWDWGQITSTTNSGVVFDINLGIDEAAAYELMIMNDNGTSFEVIADWIDENL